jgi:hypothetical protein
MSLRASVEDGVGVSRKAAIRRGSMKWPQVIQNLQYSESDNPHMAQAGSCGHSTESSCSIEGEKFLTN